jgi:peptide/nickel transport system ATP-binding protein
MADSPLLSVRDLRVSFGKDQNEVLHGISFDIGHNEILGIVGESGSGKSVTSLAIMGLLSGRHTRVSGTVLFDEEDLLQADKKTLRGLRGNHLSMIFQEPMSALNPSMKCGRQVAETLRLHLGLDRKKAKERVIELFEQVKLPRPKQIYSSYPHQISGGQMQRVMIAMAIGCKPKLLIADEPTTALDVTVQKEIMELLKSLQQETGMSILFISHDLSLVSEIADKVMVMFRGDVKESGEVSDIFLSPEDDYTRALLAARPQMDERLKHLPTVESISTGTYKPQKISLTQRAQTHKALYTRPPLLEVRRLHKSYVSKVGVFGKRKEVRAVDGVSFAIYEGETVGLVGESGCGKSTLGKTIMQLEQPSSGSIHFRGKDITLLSKDDIRRLRKDIQLIFQDPYSSLNPRIMIGSAIEEAMAVHGVGPTEIARREKVHHLLDRVGLGRDYYYRYPHELSGGQRQRVGIARTICLSPKLIVCDESVSALDISVQAQVLNLLNELKEDFGFTYLFISHDLAVVKYMSDQLLVMEEGKLVEVGDADEIYANPGKAYTKKLIDSIPKGLKDENSP